MTRIFILSLFTFVNVYGQTPCAHHANLEPTFEASNAQPQIEYLPAATNILNREYLPPPDAQPQADQAKPVYVAPPLAKETLPPLPKPIAPQATYVKPVYQPLPSTVEPKVVFLPKFQPQPQFNYIQPVYQSLPSSPLPKLAPFPQPTPQASYLKPVYQPLPSTVQPKFAPLPKLQPLPQYSNVKPVYQPLPSTIQPRIVPLPKLQPFPQATYVKPTIQALPSTPQPSFASQPLPKLQPFPSNPKPIVVQQVPFSTLRPLPNFSKQTVQSKPLYQPKDNELQSTNIVGVKYDNQFLLKSFSRPQATIVQPKISRPDLDTAAQTNRLSYANPDNIKIDHYICNLGDPQQKFLCDILKLWDIHHPKDINSNDLDNPSDNSNLNPQIARLPSSPRPTFAPLPSTPRPTFAPLPSTPRITYAPQPSTVRTTFAPVTYPSTPRPIPTTTTTTAPTEAEQDIENLPGDSQQNINAIYLPPYSTTPQPSLAPSTTQETTVEIPKRVPSESNNNIDLVTPDDTETDPQYTSPVTSTVTTTTLAPIKEGYEYPKPSVPFPTPAVPEKEGYDYPKPAIPFSDGTLLQSNVDSRFSSIPLSSFNIPSSALSLDSSKSSLSSFSESLNQYPFGLPSSSFSDSLRYQSFSPVVTSTTLSPDLYFKSSAEYVSSPAFSYSYQPLLESYSTPLTYSSDGFSNLSPFSFSTPAPPLSYSSSSPFVSYPTSAPFVSYSTSAAPLVSYSTPEPFVSYSTPAPPSSISYSSQPVTQSISTLAPLLLSKESLALTSSSQLPASLSTTTEVPIKKSSEVSTEKPLITSTTSSPLPANFDSQFFGQQFTDSLTPFRYSFQPIESFSTASPLSYSLGSFGSVSSSEKTKEVSSTEVPSGTTPVFTPPSGSSSANLFGSYFSSLSPLSYNGLSSPVSTIAPVSYGSDLSLIGSKTNFSSFSYQPVGQSFSSVSPVSYSFQPYVSGQTYNFPSFSSGLPELQSFYPGSAGISYSTSSLPSNSFQSLVKSDVSASDGKPISSSNALPSFNFQSLGQFSQSLTGPDVTPKSGLTFSANVQSVENLKDLQSTARALNIDLDAKSSQPTKNLNSISIDNHLEGKSYDPDSKEDISLGNIEILKVKRKL